MTLVKTKCSQCKKYFEAKRKIRIEQEINFCTRSCYTLWRNQNGKKPNCSCLECGKLFSRKPSAIKNGEGVYCSRECKFKVQRKGIEVRGESYSDRHLLRQSSAYKSWRAAVLKKDDYSCQDCGLKHKSLCECCKRPFYLHTHHIKPFATNPELRFDVNNGISLCNKCHSKKDKRKIN